MTMSPRFFWQSHYADPAKVMSRSAAMKAKLAQTKAQGARAASLVLLIEGASFALCGVFLLSLPLWVRGGASFHHVATAGLIFVTMGSAFLAGGAGQLVLRARRTKASPAAHQPWGRS